jgi:hypothetical protein
VLKAVENIDFIVLIISQVWLVISKQGNNEKKTATKSSKGKE